jgi:hypothetical protein
MQQTGDSYQLHAPVHWEISLRRRALIGFGLLLIALSVGYIAFAVHRSGVARSEMLRAAGPIVTTPLTTDVRLDSVIKPAGGAKNAASFYVIALNSYSARRAPYLHDRKLNPFANEPPISPAELLAILVGSSQKDCDFYAEGTGSPQLQFVVDSKGKAWPFTVGVDPFEARPYVPLMRLVAQAALNEGKRLERAKQLAPAEAIYQAVMRWGSHLRQHPGSFMDLQLGLEIELKGLHYLDQFYLITHNPTRRGMVWRYGDSVNRLQEAIRHKYALLDNPEAARIIAQNDTERVWRIEAVTALKAAISFHQVAWLEERHIAGVLAAAKTDQDRYVREAADKLSTMPAREFHLEESERKTRAVSTKKEEGL